MSRKFADEQPFAPGMVGLLPSYRAQRAVVAEQHLAVSRDEVDILQRKVAELEGIIRRQKNLLDRYQAGSSARKRG